MSTQALFMHTTRCRALVVFLSIAAVASVCGCVDPVAPRSRAVISAPVVSRNEVPCPDATQMTFGGWCLSEYAVLYALINSVYAGSGVCDTMRTTMMGWLSSGKIRRAYFAVNANGDSINGDSNRDSTVNWNNGARLNYMRLHLVNRAEPNDWASTIRHEYGHAWANVPQEYDAVAENFIGYCRDSNSSNVPPSSGPQVIITSLPSSFTMGHTVYAESSCQTTATWFRDDGIAVEVSSTGAIHGVAEGTATVRVYCSGTNARQDVTVYKPLCSLDQRLASGRGGGVGPGMLPLFELTEADCEGGAPAPSAGGMGEDGEMDCYVVMAHLYEWQAGFGWVEVSTYPVLYVCFIDGHMS